MGGIGNIAGAAITAVILGIIPREHSGHLVGVEGFPPLSVSGDCVLSQWFCLPRRHVRFGTAT
jgi:branched-subunit amino acid ABC-type transport system permease component